MNSNRLSLIGWLCMLGAISGAAATLSSPERHFYSPLRCKDLGDLLQNEAVPIEYELVNSLSLPAKIKSVYSTCGCTIGRVSTETIEPGQSTTLRATLKTGSMRGKSQVSIFVVYESGAQRKETIELVADFVVVPDIGYAPAKLEFQSYASSTQTILFSPGNLPEFRLKQALCSHPAFTAHLDQAARKVELRFDPAKWDDNNEKRVPYLIVSTDSQREPQIHIELFVNAPYPKSEKE